MIMQWKRNGADHEATWQGQSFKLVKQAADGRWHLHVDSKHVRQSWRTERDAMEAIDRGQLKVVLGASVEVSKIREALHG